jgi:tetratricopeptide (TPR) repeat protein
VEKAIAHLKGALALDPGFALAWAELARAYSTAASQGWIPVAQGYGQARDAVERALAVEPDLAEGHARMGWIRMNHDWDWRGAEASFARALAVAPGNVSVLLGAGALAFNLGRLDQAIGLYHHALERDPLCGATYNNLGVALLAADRFAEAEEGFRRSLELAPQRGSVRALTALALLAQGRGKEALAEAEREPDEALRLWALAIVHHGIGRGHEADAALQETIERFANAMAVQIAEVHGARAEVDAALAWLERAYAQRDDGLAEIKTSPRFRSLHGDPRWGAFLRKMGLDR